MRIGLIVHRFPPDIGGSERYTEVVATKLHEHGHNITVYTSDHLDRDLSSFPFQVREFKNRIPESFGYFAWPGIFSPHELRSLREQDVIHAVPGNMFSAVVGAVINRLFGVPAVLTTFYHPPELQAHAKLNEIYDRYVLQRVLEQYNHVIVSSQFELEHLSEQFDISRINIKRMKIPSTAESAPTTDFRNRYDLDGKFVVLYVGRLDSHKGMSSLLPAIDTLSDEISSLRCIVVGETERWHEWPEEVTQTVEQNRESFIFTGVRTGGALTAVYEASDLFVFPSEYETYGLVTVEALSHSTPVISTPVGVAPELIEDGVNGFTYPVGDTDELVDRIRTVYTSSLDELQTNAKASVSHLSWDATIVELESLYQT